MQRFVAEISWGVRVPTSVGVMILSNAVLFPGAMLPLRIFEPRYRAMLKDALATHRMFCVAMQRPQGSRESPLPVAGLGVVRYAVRDEDGTSRLLIQGVARVKLGRAKRYKPFRVHPIQPLSSEVEDSPALDALRYKVLEMVEQRLRTSPPFSEELFRSLTKGNPSPDPVEACMKSLRAMAHPGQLADIIALLMVDDPFFRHMILQSHDLTQRYRNLVFLLREPSEPFGDNPLDDGTEDQDVE